MALSNRLKPPRISPKEKNCDTVFIRIATFRDVRKQILQPCKGKDVRWLTERMM
jgi:hypothetical protein